MVLAVGLLVVAAELWLVLTTPSRIPVSLSVRFQQLRHSPRQVRQEGHSLALRRAAEHILEGNVDAAINRLNRLKATCPSQAGRLEAGRLLDFLERARYREGSHELKGEGDFWLPGELEEMLQQRQHW